MSNTRTIETNHHYITRNDKIENNYLRLFGAVIQKSIKDFQKLHTRYHDKPRRDTDDTKFVNYSSARFYLFSPFGLERILKECFMEGRASKKERHNMISIDYIRQIALAPFEETEDDIYW